MKLETIVLTIVWIIAMFITGLIAGVIHGEKAGGRVHIWVLSGIGVFITGVCLVAYNSL